MIPRPNERCARIVLDTNVARDLGEMESEPLFLQVFEEMAAAGYVFHLADGAWAELLDQRERGSIGDVVLDRMFVRLDRILNAEAPVFLGNRDVRAFIGEDVEGVAWTQENFVATSQRALAILRAAEVNGEVASSEDRTRASAEVLQEAREGWIAHFDQMLQDFPPTAADDELGGPTFDAFVSRVDGESNLPHPPMSKRLDLGLRYAWRQHVRRNRSQEPYDPESHKKRNDGIDFELYYFMMLPCLLVTSDSGFGSRLAPIQSFQRSWIYTPEQLAEARQANSVTLPNWRA
jgi:hypothetical protein